MIQCSTHITLALLIHGSGANDLKGESINHIMRSKDRLSRTLKRVFLQLNSINHLLTYGPGWLPAIIFLRSSSSVIKLKAHCTSNTVRWSPTRLSWSAYEAWFPSASYWRWIIAFISSPVRYDNHLDRESNPHTYPIAWATSISYWKKPLKEDDGTGPDGKEKEQAK